MFADVDRCDPNPCFHGSTCEEINGGEGFVCNCNAGYKGKMCESKIPYLLEKIQNFKIRYFRFDFGFLRLNKWRKKCFERILVVVSFKISHYKLYSHFTYPHAEFQKFPIFPPFQPYFGKKLGGKEFFRLKKGGEDFLKICFPKTQPRYPSKFWAVLYFQERTFVNRTRVTTKGCAKNFHRLHLYHTTVIISTPRNITKCLSMKGNDIKI